LDDGACRRIVLCPGFESAFDSQADECRFIDGDRDIFSKKTATLKQRVRPGAAANGEPQIRSCTGRLATFYSAETMDFFAAYYNDNAEPWTKTVRVEKISGIFCKKEGGGDMANPAIWREPADRKARHSGR
jgi:hypothetical protein